MIENYHYNPRTYFGLTFLATFIFWFGGAFASFSEKFNDLYMLFMLCGMIAPFVVGLVMMRGKHARPLRKDFFNRLVNVRLINLKTLPAFFLLMPMVVLASTILSLLFGEPMTQFQPAEGFSFSSGFVPVLMLLLLAVTFEALGWRGYAFDSLQSRYTYLTASIIFSLLWSLWHLPLLFVKDSYQYEIMQISPWFALNFFLGIIPLGIIISWFCAKNRKSIISAILFHFMVNMSQELLNITQVTKTIETFVLAFVAAGIILMDRELFLSRKTVTEAVPA